MLEFEGFFGKLLPRIWQDLYLTGEVGEGGEWKKSKSHDAQLEKGKNEIWQCRNLWQKSAQIPMKIFKILVTCPKLNHHNRHNHHHQHHHHHHHDHNHEIFSR